MKRTDTSPYTFRPHLNKNSLKMAEKLGSSRNRLTRPSKFTNSKKSVEKYIKKDNSNYLDPKSPDSLPQSRTFSSHSDACEFSIDGSGHKFTPAINPKSRQIANKLTNGPMGRSTSALGEAPSYRPLTW